MSTVKRLVLATVVLGGVVGVCLAVPVVLAQQPAPRAEPAPGILLLRNGNVLQGRITQTGDHYAVALDSGEIYVKATDVEFRCRSLEEGYQRKRALVQPGDVREHLELAQWCQRHGLLASAARELAEARTLAPAHPLIPLVERRIKMSLCQPEKTEPAVEPVDTAPSPDELDQLVRGMPPGSVETFTQTVQPLLANHCSAAGCHGPQTESRFRLLRLPWGRPASRRLTQRNLHSTLQWIDRSDPAASTLLTAPVQPHGSAKTAIFTDRQLDQYRQIVDWVYQVAHKDQPVTTVSHEAPQELPGKAKPPWLAMPAVHTAPGQSAGDAPPDGGLDPSNPDPPTQNDQVDPGRATLHIDPQRTVPSSIIIPGTTLPQFVPADPFDPEIFNRRFHSQDSGGGKAR